MNFAKWYNELLVHEPGSIFVNQKTVALFKNHGVLRLGQKSGVVNLLNESSCRSFIGGPFLLI